MPEKLVSVVIPTHKGSENIVKSVKSALTQTYKNIEVIVVDDNGKGTHEQLETEKNLRIFSQTPNFKYIAHEKNINGSAARNTGIRASKGEYIALLDDDDLFMPNNIEKHIEVIEKLPNDYGITYCGMRLFTPGFPEQIIMPTYEGNILFDFLCGKLRVGSSLIMIKREAVNYVNGFDESFKRHQDWEFIVRILDKYKIAIVNNVGVEKYNLNRNSAKNPQKFEDNRLYYLDKMRYIIEKFEKKEQTQIYDCHYFLIAKEYLRVKDFFAYVKWVNRTSNPLKSCCKTLSSYISFLKRIK